MFYRLDSTPKWQKWCLSFCQRNFPCKTENYLQVRRVDKVPGQPIIKKLFFWLLNFWNKAVQISTVCWSNALMIWMADGQGIWRSVSFCVILCKAPYNWQAHLQGTWVLKWFKMSAEDIDLLVNYFPGLYLAWNRVSANLVTHGCLKKASGLVSVLHSNFPWVCACWLVGVSGVFGKDSEYSKFPHKCVVYLSKEPIGPCRFSKGFCCL